MHEEFPAPDAKGNEYDTVTYLVPKRDLPVGPGPLLGGIYVGPPVIRRALIFSFSDGIMSNGMQALLDTFGIAGAIALRTTSMGIALMSSLPMLLGSIAQFLLPAYADPAKGRKHYVLLGVAGQILFLYLAGLAGWLPGQVRAWAYAGFFIVAAVSSSLTGPYWVGWMGDLVPGSVRGRHFAWRNIFFAWMYLACALASGTLSRRYGTENAPWMLFACVFASAATLRLISHRMLARQHEPVSALGLEAFEPFRFRPNREFLVFCLATGAFQGAAALSGPFFNVWYLRDLHFNYLFISIALGATVLGSIACSGFWGRLADGFGAARALWISGLLVTCIPIPYLFFERPWQVWAICFYSGASWGGYNLASFSHLLHATDQRHRSHYIGFNSLIIGLMGFGFALLGGFLATRVPLLFHWRLQSLFLLSAVFRLAIFVFLFGRFRGSRRPYPTVKPPEAAVKPPEAAVKPPATRLGAGRRADRGNLPRHPGSPAQRRRNPAQQQGREGQQ